MFWKAEQGKTRMQRNQNRDNIQIRGGKMRGQTKQDSLWEETEEKTSNDVYCVTGS